MEFERISKILADCFDVEESEITPETNLVEDLGADSLDLVELVSTIEDEFSIEIEEDAIENISTVGDIVDYVKSLASNI